MFLIQHNKNILSKNVKEDLNPGLPNYKRKITILGWIVVLNSRSNIATVVCLMQNWHSLKLRGADQRTRKQLAKGHSHDWPVTRILHTTKEQTRLSRCCPIGVQLKPKPSWKQQFNCSANTRLIRLDLFVYANHQSTTARFSFAYIATKWAATSEFVIRKQLLYKHSSFFQLALLPIKLTFARFFSFFFIPNLTRYPICVSSLSTIFNWRNGTCRSVLLARNKIFINTSIFVQLAILAAKVYSGHERGWRLRDIFVFLFRHCIIFTFWKNKQMFITENVKKYNFLSQMTVFTRII